MFQLWALWLVTRFSTFSPTHYSLITISMVMTEIIMKTESLMTITELCGWAW